MQNKKNEDIHADKDGGSGSLLNILFIFVTKCNCLQCLEQVEKELHQSKGRVSKSVCDLVSQWISYSYCGPNLTQ